MSETSVQIAFIREEHKREMDGMADWIKGIDDRMRVIERLVWIAIGGVVVLGALMSIIGGNILRLLGHS